MQLILTLFSTNSCKYHCLQTEPGLDKFVGNATGNSGCLLEDLETLLFFVLVTAGLRRLPLEDTRQVLNDVEEVLKEHSFVHRRSWIRVLSGKEEAYYGWVALNYRMGHLRNPSQGSTLGLIDLGDSSLQVVVEGNDGARDETNLIRKKIGSVEHHILAYSLSSFGLNGAFDRTVAMLSQLQPNKGNADERYTLRHPCLGLKFEQNFTCYACDGLNITYKKNLNNRKHKTKDIYLVGEADWEHCIEVARAAAMNSSRLDGLQPTVHTNCKSSLSSYNGNRIFNLTAATNPTSRFHALSGFFAVYNMLNLAPQANMTSIWEKREQLCSTSWGDLSNISGNQNSFAHYCFQVPYMASLIKDALCLGDFEIIFDPGDIFWTLGAALIEGEYLWLSISRTNISSSGKKVKLICPCWERRPQPLGHLCPLTSIQNGVQTNVRSQLY
ncbi:adenosine diphosphatase, putative [Ricinus communis]|uniref:Adenosine diphosphatase, putative n=1 Tax=Ricinus communis TaxID=3988 RepID=B9RAY7_RICCO|nr:adenosine diphosphatase, putative [Ricinus communis]